MVRKNKIQEQILRDILLKMNYDSSKTLNENITEQSFKYTPTQQDNLSPSRITPEIEMIKKNPEQYYKAISLRYSGKKKPEKAIVHQSSIGAPGKDYSNTQTYTLNYSSNRAKISLCNTSEGKKFNCYCVGGNKYNKTVFGPYCKGNVGKNKLNTIYDSDFKDWRNNNPVPKLSDDALHWLLPLGAFAITVMTGGIGGLVIAGVLEAADIAIYIKEKEYTAAGVGAVFAFIPGLMLANQIPLVRKFTSGQLKVLLNKIKKGLDLSPIEQQLTKQIDINAQWLSKNADNFMKIGNLSSKLLSKYTGKKLIAVILYMSKIGLIPWKAGWRVAALGGGLLTFMQIGKILGVEIQGLDYRNVKLPESYTSLSEEKKSTVIKDVQMQIIEQSPEIKEWAEKEMSLIINTLPEQKAEILAVSMENIEKALVDLTPY